tara:strand:- start:5445 stop:8630 length:3186 start_codon:yes stop_codon:yes gene_type:complete
MTNKYPNIKSNPDFSEIETKIQSKWSKKNIFNKSIDIRDAQINSENNEFIFYDGPPFANGLPHYGHLLTGFVKDIFARYQTIKGKKVERRFGWDTHGLPVEMETEKELGVSGQIAIKELGIDKFNKACEKSVMKYADQWQEYVTKQGRWVDFENDYKTMDINYMESVIWAFKQLYDKGLVYQDQRVMPYSWKCETPLSNFETRLDNSYREKESKALTLTFQLNQQIHAKKVKILVWTTTPWTLTSNLALAVNNNIKYSIIEKSGEYFCIASNLITKYKKELSTGEEIEIFKEIEGKELVGKTYEPVFDYLASDKEKYDLKNAFTIYHADFVNIEEGTGAVHIAPGFGEDDQILCKENSIPTICPINEKGEFIEPVNDFIGQQVFETNIEIIKALKAKGLWIKTEQYLHNYPHCWRSDTPLIYRALPSWYVKVTDIKDRMVELNKEINWIPDHIKNGIFGKWLENARDWSISRNRFWGCPVPVWISDDPNYPRIDVYGSIAELEKDFKVKVTNLHRPFIDELTRVNPDDPSGKAKMVRVTDVLDCWFESGSMPYAQAHYPFENKELFESHFPADFIVEYVAQTRGWFYTLMVLSTALFDRPPFKNCICHGVILDEKSQKLSKRLKNYTSPLEIFKKYGSDSMRFFMGHSAVMRGNELNIDKEGNVFKESLRLYIKPIWNSFNFFTIYANADKLEAHLDLKSKNLLDIYIYSKLKAFIKKIEKSLDEYNLPAAYEDIHQFFELLNNWYIRRNRERFWKKDKDSDKQSAYNCLYAVLYYTMRAISPLIPHISEEIFQGLQVKNASESVHLENFPTKEELEKLPEDTDLLNKMDQIRNICTTGHSIRSKSNIRTRQPLAKVEIIGERYNGLGDFKELIADELNVKQVYFSNKINDLADLRLTLNFKSLGKKYPKEMKILIANSKQGKWQKKNDKIQIEDITLEQDEFDLLLVPKQSDNMAALPENDALVALDINLTQELIEEGYIRDIVRLIQQARKDLDLQVTNHIKINFTSNSTKLKEIIDKNISYINEQTLAKKVSYTITDKEDDMVEIDKEMFLRIEIEKV